MSGKIDVESPSASVTRRQPLLTTPMTLSSPTNSAKNGRRGSRVGETAGECAAVCCCCPCAMMHVLILAVYRVPRGIWRKKKRRSLLRKKRKHSLQEKENQRKTNSLGFNAGDEEEEEEEESSDVEDDRGKNDVVDWDNEMWNRFHGAGFWRSVSQRKDDD